MVEKKLPRYRPGKARLLPAPDRNKYFDPFCSIATSVSALQIYKKLSPNILIVKIVLSIENI
jgi:hypothetical protein